MSNIKMGLTIEEAAECTGIGRNTMRKLVDWGKLPVLKVGRKAIIRRDTRYEPQEVLEDFTEEFRRRYGVECVSALHHNKRKTNYHIHLIFSERKLLPEPDIKIATRSVFYDETGKRVRTKKEITGEDGQIRKGCTVIKKGEIYESHLFTVKDDKFKSEPFLREVKEIYTDLINRHISDPEQQLKVFDKNSVYTGQYIHSEIIVGI